MQRRQTDESSDIFFMPDDITPDTRDFQAIEQEHGRLRANASDEERQRYYYLALMLKMIRLHEHGRLPLPLMHEMDSILERVFRRAK